jgi:flavin-dependent dehydrogenase
MSEHAFDVAIIGAGPAGSTLASLLARAGIRVAIVDRDTFPRDKLCGEFLSYDALPVLDAIGVVEEIDAAGATRITTCRLIGTKREFQFDFPQTARGISRMRMDHLLLRRATHLGAIAFQGWTAESLVPEHRLTKVTVRQGDERVTISARVACGAWGRWGRFDRLLSRKFTSRSSGRYFGYKRHYRPAPNGTAPPPDTIDLYAYDRGYLGVNWIEGDETNICGLVHESRLGGHKGGWAAFVDALRHERESIDRLYSGHEATQPDFLSSEPVVFTPRTVVEDHIVLSGDAAGLIDPLAGNGMAMAIQSAALAAPLIRSFLSGTLDRAAMERNYIAGHARLFSSRIRWSRRIAWLLTRPRLLDLAMSLHLPGGIGRNLLERTRATGDQVDALVRSNDPGRT